MDGILQQRNYTNWDMGWIDNTYYVKFPTWVGEEIIKKMEWTIEIDSRVKFFWYYANGEFNLVDVHNFLIHVNDITECWLPLSFSL